LWNLLIPEVFNGPVLTFWQAIGLLILAKLFFGTWHRPYNQFYNKWHPGHRFWKMKLEEKMASMNPDERDKFREEWKRHCSHEYRRHWHHRDQGEDK